MTSLTASPNPIRVGAVAAIFAGVCIVGHSIPTIFDKNPMDLNSLADYLMEIIFGAGYAALLIFFGTLLRLRTGRGTNVYGRLGRVGAYAGTIGSVLIVVETLLIVVLGATFAVQAVLGSLIVIFGLYIVGSSLASLLGPVLLGIATLRARLLTRWIGLALVIVPLVVLVVTMLEDDDSVFAAMRVGARGYLLKGAEQSEVLRAIRAVANGEAIFGPGIARRVMGLFSVEKPQAPQAFPELTEREQEILRLIAGGRSNAEISSYLFLSLKTVQNHVSNIFRKLQVADRAQAVIRAREAGLGDGP